MSKADYTYEVGKYKHKVDVITIKDMNLGNISVTNSIAAVINEICQLEKIQAKDYMIVYRDSFGLWDGYEPVKDEFIGLGMDTWYDAIQVWISRMTEL